MSTDGISGRHLVAPWFLLSTQRAGSTLLRCILDTHSDIHAPEEVHLEGIKVEVSKSYSELGLRQRGIVPHQVTYAAWDWILYTSLANSGKGVLVEKCPRYTIMWEQLVDAWPDCRFIYLHRDPNSVARSLITTGICGGLEEAADRVLEFATCLREAEDVRGGVVVRYEDLTASPEATISSLLHKMGLSYEPAILSYGRVHRSFLKGLGDWGDRIESGRILPDEGTNSDSVVESVPALTEARMLMGYA